MRFGRKNKLWDYPFKLYDHGKIDLVDQEWKGGGMLDYPENG